MTCSTTFKEFSLSECFERHTVTSLHNELKSLQYLLQSFKAWLTSPPSSLSSLSGSTAYAYDPLSGQLCVHRQTSMVWMYIVFPFVCTFPVYAAILLYLLHYWMGIVPLTGKGSGRSMTTLVIWQFSLWSSLTNMALGMFGRPYMCTRWTH